MRPKRRKELTPEQVEQYVREATAYHKALVKTFMVLKPGADQYRLLQVHHRELISIIRQVSGDDPPWALTPRAR